MGDGNPIVAAGALEGLVALVEQHRHGVLMISRHDVTGGIVRIVGPLRAARQPDGVGREVVGSRLDVERIALRIGNGRRDRAARLPELQQQKRPQCATGSRANCGLLHIEPALGVVLHLLAHVTEGRAGKKVGPLGEARHARFVDEGGRRFDTLQRLERIGAEMKRTFGIRDNVEPRFLPPHAQPPRKPMTARNLDKAGRRQWSVGCNRKRRRHCSKTVPFADIGVDQCAAAHTRETGGDGEAAEVNV